MKAKILTYTYCDSSGFGVEKVYMEVDFEQAERDLALLEKYSDMRTFQLIDSEVYDKFKKPN